MNKFFVLGLVFLLLIFSSPITSSADINLLQQPYSKKNLTLELAKKDRLFIGMTKTEAYEVEGVPFRTNRIPGEDGKEMWVYQCNNDDGFNEDCLYLYFEGNELNKIERP